VITVVNHLMLLTVALLHPHGLLLIAAAVPVSVGFAIGTVTVLHDAGRAVGGPLDAEAPDAPQALAGLSLR